MSKGLQRPGKDGGGKEDTFQKMMEESFTGVMNMGIKLKRKIVNLSKPTDVCHYFPLMDYDSKLQRNTSMPINCKRNINENSLKLRRMKKGYNAITVSPGEASVRGGRCV